MRQTTPKTKVFYRPIEAAIRWAGLLQYEQAILDCVLSPRELPELPDCPRQDELRLCLDRIYDGLANGELPYGRNGITANDAALLDSPDLAVRHLDLKHWMRTYYPEHRPDFLFCRSERLAHPTLTLEAGQALLVERQAMKVELWQYRHRLRDVQAKTQTARSSSRAPISDRAETTYLHIIGAMLDLMLGESPSGKRYSRFDTQGAIVSTLVASYGSKMGISERTLGGKFAEAKRQLLSTLA